MADQKSNGPGVYVVGEVRSIKPAKNPKNNIMRILTEDDIHIVITSSTRHKATDVVTIPVRPFATKDGSIMFNELI